LRFDLPINANVSQIQMQTAIHEGISHSSSNLSSLTIFLMIDSLCGRQNEFYNVTPACRFCSVQQAHAYQHSQRRR